MGKINSLIANASRDFEMAKDHKRGRDYMTAIILYNKAVEKVLKALFITKTHREPPANASIGYLASRTGMPAEISVYINTLQEQEPSEMTEFQELEQGASNGSPEMRAFFLDGLAKRLLDYVIAYNR
jgi:HEPN domain-containing protein